MEFRSGETALLQQRPSVATPLIASSLGANLLVTPQTKVRERDLCCLALETHPTKERKEPNSLSVCAKRWEWLGNGLRAVWGRTGTGASTELCEGYFSYTICIVFDAQPDVTLYSEVHLIVCMLFPSRKVPLSKVQRPAHRTPVSSFCHQTTGVGVRTGDTAGVPAVTWVPLLSWKPPRPA